MNADDVGNFLSRWSRRKLEKADPKDAPGAVPALQPAAESALPAPANAAAPAPEPLPPVETLTPESDFKPFMQPDVEAGVKQAALKQLFKDPHFNVMDGLDTYIDDYTIADPIPDEMMKTMYQARQHLLSDEEKAAADAVDAAAEAEATAAADAAAEANAAEISAELLAGPALDLPNQPAPAPEEKT